MKTYKKLNGPITSINGKNPVKVIKSSKQYEKVITPFIYDGIIIDESTLKKGKVYKDKIHNHLYILGVNTIWQIEEIENRHYFKPSENDKDFCAECGKNFRDTDKHIVSNLHPVFQDILKSFINF